MKPFVAQENTLTALFHCIVLANRLFEWLGPFVTCNGASKGQRSTAQHSGQLHSNISRTGFHRIVMSPLAFATEITENEISNRVKWNTPFRCNLSHIAHPPLRHLHCALVCAGVAYCGLHYSVTYLSVRYYGMQSTARINRIMNPVSDTVQRAADSSPDDA